MLMRRGSLDASANHVPAAVLARCYADRHVDELAVEAESASSIPSSAPSVAIAGAKCPDCGARVLRKVDGSGLGRSKIYQAIKVGDFPAPVKLYGRSSASLSTEIDAWVRRVVEARNRTACSMSSPPQR